MEGDRGTAEGQLSPTSADGSPWGRRIESVVQSLQARFGPTVAPDLIRVEVEGGFAAYDGARIRDFVPILVEARVRSRLTQGPLA